MKSSSKIRELFQVCLFILGPLLFALTQRYFLDEKFGAGLQVGSFFLILIGFFGCLFELRKQKLQSVLVYRLYWMLLFCAGIASYLILQKFTTVSSVQSFLPKYLTFQWVSLIVVGLFVFFGTELTLANTTRDPRRTRGAFAGFLALGLFCTGLGWLNFAFDKKNKSLDVSFLKTALPLSATQNTAAGLKSVVDVVVFFPVSSDVRGYVVNYFDALKNQPNLNIRYADKDMDPVLAKEFQTPRNGQVVLRSGNNFERIDIGLNLNNARKTLKNFDEEFQKSLLVLTTERRNVYFSTGHGEMSWKTQEEEPLKTIKSLESVLRANNLTPRFWGSSEGSLREVPKDAAAIVIAGASSDFLVEEVKALKEYIQTGGSVMIYCGFDQGGEKSIGVFKTHSISDNPLYNMLKEFGISYTDTPLADTTEFVRATQSPVDSWFLVSNQFSSHEAMTTLTHNDERLGVLAFKTGFLTTVSEIGSWNLSPLLKSLPSSFNDDDKNFQLTPNSSEKKGSYTLAAVATSKNPDPKKAGKILVFAGASMISDALIRNRGNIVLFADALKWATGDTKRQGQTRSEDDVPIRHTKKQDMIYFYLTVALMPILVLLAGFVATRRKSRMRSAL